MDLVQFCLTFLLMWGHCRVQAHPPQPVGGKHVKQSSGDEGGGRINEKQPQPQKHNSTEGHSSTENRTVLPLGDVFASLGGTTLAQLTNLQLSIPVDLDFDNINPDFSRMVLNVNYSIKSMEIDGDYKLFVQNDVNFPAYGQGNICIKLRNVTVTGRTLLALTPAALLSLNFDIAYTIDEVTAKVIPLSEITTAQEVYLSKDIVSGGVAALISKNMEDQLNYYVEMHINLALSKINVFTIGHRSEQPVINGKFTQNVQIGDLFDEMLADVRKDILGNRKDEIDIENFRRNFSEKVDSVVVNGTFVAEEGWIVGLSAFKRSSNVSLAKSGEMFILSAMLEFEDLQMGYDKYVATFLRSKLTGKLDGNFIHRQFTVKVAMDPKGDGTCTSALHDIRLIKTNGYRIQEISNIGSYEWLHIRINNWLIGYFKTQIAKDIEKVLSAAVSNSLSGFDCGEFLPSFKIL
jgi:translation initiation factor 2 beta subunit (eIF-2beta)/eIF-5